MKIGLGHIVLAIALGSGMFASTANAQDTNTYLYIAHAASGRDFSSTANPEFPVDISVNGTCVAKGISFGEIRGPYTAPAGQFNFKVSVANSITPCGNTAIFSAANTMSAAITYLGVISLNASNHLAGAVYPLDLSSIPPHRARDFVVNATTENLRATITSTPTTDGSGGGVNVPAGTLQLANPPLGIWYTSVYMEQNNTLEAGPAQVETLARNAYIYVFAGSAVNGTVQLIGPKVIHGVF